MQNITRLLRRISNLCTIDGRKLSDAAVFNGYSLWLGRQYSLFTALMDATGVRKTAFTTPSGSGPRVAAKSSVRLQQFVAMLVTTASVIWLIISRGRLLIFDLERNNPVSHSGSRIRRVYELADEYGLKYGMLVHSLFNDDFWTFLFNVRCPVIYAESVYLLARFLAYVLGGGPVIKINEWHDIPEAVRPLVERELRQLPTACWNARLFSYIGCVTGIKSFISYDDIRHTTEMLIGFKMANVRSIIAQHSNFNYFASLDIVPPELSIFPDIFCVASLYWSRRLPQLSQLFAYYHDRLRVTGWLGSQLTNKFGKRISSRKERNILIPYEFLEDYYLMTTIISTLVRNDYFVVFKVKPRSNIEDQLKAYGVQKGTMGIKVIETLDDKVLNTISAAIGVYSTLLDEMILSGVPVGIVKSQFPVFDDKVGSGIADSINPEKDFVAQVRDLCDISEKEIERRRLTYGDTGAHADVVLRELFT